MFNPRKVFEDPAAYRSMLTSIDDGAIESQYFERKEAGRPDASGKLSNSQAQALRDHVRECVSAFANSNRDGGLLVLGITKGGRVEGVDHLTDEQHRSLLAIDDLLVNQAAQATHWSCTNDQGQVRKVCLVFIPYAEHAICESRESPPRAWMRHGAQNLPMTESQREQLRRDKRIVDFERTYCCPFVPGDVDPGVLAEFRQSYLSDGLYEQDDQQLLYQAGAIVKNGSGLRLYERWPSLFCLQSAADTCLLPRPPSPLRG